MPTLDLPDLPSVDESREILIDVEEVVETKAKRIWRGFADFALQDNVLQVAVGLM